MALQSRVSERIGAESLEEPWEAVGSGGFGYVYKARHKKWRFDVAIKLLRHEVGLLEEANIMDLASCDFVLRVYGVFEGCPPIGQRFVQQGIVMEFMRRGSIETLQRKLCGRLPAPLVARLAHEVALGMNFLHSKNLMHSDLKPSNVLLNDDLHAKLADFGLSRVSTSATNNSIGTTGQVAGTFMYMPPEAFDASYKPVRSFDVYSYGIFLWSVLSGKQPYATPAANSSVVAVWVGRGERPSLNEADHSRSEGLAELVELMEICWDGEPSNRPSFKGCVDVTEAVFLKHERGISDAVSKVLTSLESPGGSPLTPDRSSSHDSVDQILPETYLHQTLVRRMSDTDKATFVDANRAALIQKVPEVMAIVDQLGDMVHSETYSVIESKQTSQDKMRELFQRTFRSGGVKVKAAFYDILSKDYPNLVKSLGGELE